MEERVLIQFRADKTLKQEVSDIYEELGMDLPTAFRMFMKRSKQVNGLPFEARLPEPEIPNSVEVSAPADDKLRPAEEPELLLDEICAEA